MTFKEQVEWDNENVFLNLNDFAESCRIEGKEVTAVVDNDSFVKMKQGQILGMVEADILIFAKTSDLPLEKAIGSILNVNGKECIVAAWGSSMGMSEVALRQNRTM